MRIAIVALAIAAATALPRLRRPRGLRIRRRLRRWSKMSQRATREISPQLGELQALLVASDPDTGDASLAANAKAGLATARGPRGTSYATVDATDDPRRRPRRRRDPRPAQAVAVAPEALQFALIAGAHPLVGLGSTLVVGAVCAILGGRPGMVSGASATGALVLAPLVREHGSAAMPLAVACAGLVQLLVGYLRGGRLVRMLPHPVVRSPRRYSAETSRGGAAAATWRFREDELGRRRGREGWRFGWNRRAPRYSASSTASR